MGNMSRIPRMILGAAIVWMLLMGQAIAASSSAVDNGVFPQKEQNALVDQLKQLTGLKVRMGTHALTGKVRYIGVDPSNPIRQPAALSAKPTPEEAARGFLSTYGSLFGLTDQARELSVMHTKSGEQGRSFVRFQQVHSSIPVFGGELIVQTNASNNIVSAHGKVLPGVSVNTTPVISAEVAVEEALRLVIKHYRGKYAVDMASLQVSKPELWVYNPMIFGMNRNLTNLVWRMEVYPTELLPIKELVLIDAHAGKVALHFNQIDTALYRLIYDHNNTVGKPLPGNPADLKRSEGGPATGIADVDHAYDYAGLTYNFYWNYHGRDSLDGAGMQLISTTRYCPDASHCPYANAFWNGSQMVYGDTYASALDVVGHEMTHGVTEHESHLYYYMQSGAINESFSDIWGEFIEHDHTPGGDTAWLMGEDLPGGAIRSMSNPPTYGDPDRMGSANYQCLDRTDIYFDEGGVHTNSGVSNKAAYLITNGGPFNGFTVTGIGITKAAKIYYEVQTHLFTSAGDYNDLYDALRQACANLVGTNGITVSDCQQVENAVNATEMNQQPASCQAQEAPVCDSGQIVTLFFDDLENTSSGKWTKGYYSTGNQWYYPQNTNPYGLDLTYGTSGQYNFFGDDICSTSDSYIAMTQNVSIPAGAYLHFNHAYNFETTYDGGVIEYTTNNGSTWNDAGSLITYNGYNGTLSSSNPMGTRQAFTGYTRGYISTRLNLSSLAGQNVKFRFRIGTDSSGCYWGWWIDDIRIYTCSAAVCSQFGFNEDFNDSAANNWVNDGSGRWSTTTGSVYRMTGTGAGTWAWAYYSAPYCDFTYQARLRKTGGDANYNMGIWFRTTGSVSGGYPQYGYTFYIRAASGYYSLYKYTGGVETTLISDTFSSAINTGLSNWNVLKVVASGSKISLYANGTLLNTVTDSTYLSGNVGITAYDISSSTTVEYDVATLDTAGKITADFNFDWNTDILWRHKTSGQNSVWLMNGTTWSSSAWLPTVADTNWEIVGTGDFNIDGNTDILWRHKTSGQNSVWLMNGTTWSSSAWLPTVADTNWEIVGTGDFNGDGNTDILWRHKTSGQNLVWLMNETTWSNSAWLPSVTDTNWAVAGTGDFNGDGKTDILWRHKTSGQNLVWLMNGTTWSSSVWLPTVADTNWEVAGAGDFNGDGKTDILWRHKTTGQNAVWLMDGTTWSSSAWLPTVADTNWAIVGP